MNQPTEQQKPTSETNAKPTLDHFAKAEGEEKRREGEEKGIEPPLPPSGGNGQLLEVEPNEAPAKPPAKSEVQRRAEKLFRRRESTPWGAAELRAWKANRATIEATTPEDWAALEAFYAFHETDRHVVYRRQDLATLLNNWAGEIDKAHAFRVTGPKLKPGAPYIANEAKVSAEQADFDARYGNKGF